MVAAGAPLISEMRQPCSWDKPSAVAAFFRLRRSRDGRHASQSANKLRTSFLHIAETDCVADDAVRCQPVSGIEFPGNREINREFCKFGPFLAILAPNRRANSMDCSKNSLCTGTGNFLEDYRENRVFL